MTDAIRSQSDIKSALRSQARQARAAAARRPGGADTLAGLADRLAIAAGGAVAGYWPLGDEMDPRPLMAVLAGRGCRLLLPAVVGGDILEFRPWRPGEELEAGPHGTRHPVASAGTARPDVVLVPMLAFDARGFRLGYGGGYYDRVLANLRAQGAVVAVGLAYAAQQVAKIPAEEWDQRLDVIVTERGVMTVVAE